MYVKQVVFGLMCLSCCYCIRIWRHKSSCDRPGTGFTCLPKIGDKRTIIVECPSKTRSYHIYVNEFSGPNTLENLIIKNCKSLTILLRCTKYAWEKKNLKYLEISNIETLKIQNVALYQSLLPPTVVFENIKSIENIPSHTFTQTNKKQNLIRCVLPNYSFHSIHFRNVSINTVQPKAFYMPNNFGNVTFTNVRIKALDTSSIIVSHARNSLFLFEDSTVGVIKPSAIQAVAQKIVFSKNKFVEISSTGIRVKTDVFNFVNNTVDRLFHREGLFVTSQHVLVSSNHFKHLKTGAFSGMGGLGNHMGHYEFVGNVMDFLEDNSLLPKLHTYKNISAQATIKSNTFFCECYQSGSLLTKIEKKSSQPTTNEFYKKLFHKQSGNVCSGTCRLPLYEAKKKIVQGKCANSITVAGLCAARKKTEVDPVTGSPKTSTHSSIPFKSSASSFNQNNTIVKIDELKLGSNTIILPTTRKITPTGPTKLLPFTSPDPSYSISSHGSTNNKSINEQKLIKSTLQLPTTFPTFAPIKTLPITYTSAAYSSSETASSDSTYGSSNNDLLTLSATKEKLEIKKTSSPLATEVITSTVTSTEDDTSLASPMTSTITSTSNEDNTSLSASIRSTATVTSNEEDTSVSSLKTLSSILQKITNSNSSIEDKITSTYTDLSIEENYSLSSEASLTTATVSATTIPTTKYKPGVLNESVKIFTPVYVIETSTPKQTATSFYKEFVVITTNSSVKWVVGNCSKCYLSSSILFILVSFVLNVL